jgi:hypothetical protein
MSKQDPLSESTPKARAQQELEMLRTILELEAQGKLPSAEEIEEAARKAVNSLGRKATQQDDDDQ